MDHLHLNLRTQLFCTIFFLAFSILLCSPPPALGQYLFLKRLILAYNLEAHENSLKDGSYRGEEGILRARPETGLSLGMKVYIDQDYKDATALFQKAEKALEEAKRLMETEQRERFSGEHARRITEQYITFKKAIDLGKEKMSAYRSRLKQGVDDRLDREKSAVIFEKLLMTSIKRTDHRLRDALGHFYNVSQGLNLKNHYLTPENVPFVNKIFDQFSSQAKGETMRRFDFDKNRLTSIRTLSTNWKKVVEKRCRPFIPLIDANINRHKGNDYTLDPLLLVALMKRESSFDPRAVSTVGAAGLMQIMPKTAKSLGMKNVFQPTYFDEAFTLMAQERHHRRQALEILIQINRKDGHQLATKARKVMQKSLALGRKKEGLFQRYRKELLRKGEDNRLKPAQAIEYGYKYLSQLMKDQKGDMSLALASYNAGPHRVKQYNGIPPYTETVHFRNLVLKYYREYLRKAAEPL